MLIIQHLIEIFPGMTMAKKNWQQRQQCRTKQHGAGRKEKTIRDRRVCVSPWRRSALCRWINTEDRCRRTIRSVNERRIVPRWVRSTKINSVARPYRWWEENVRGFESEPVKRVGCMPMETKTNIRHERRDGGIDVNEGELKWTWVVPSKEMRYECALLIGSTGEEQSGSVCRIE